MALLQHAVAVAREYLWGFPMLALLFGTHLYFTFHLGFIQKKNPVGNPVVTDRNEESGKGSGNTVFGAGDGACSDDRYG